MIARPSPSNQIHGFAGLVVTPDRVVALPMYLHAGLGVGRQDEQVGTLAALDRDHAPRGDVPDEGSARGWDAALGVADCRALDALDLHAPAEAPDRDPGRGRPDGPLR